MSYRIGSFNLKRLGLSSISDSHPRDLQTIANIIRDEQFDIVALQEVFSGGKAFTFTSKEHSKDNIINALGGNKRWGFAWADADGGDYEGYAFIWNLDRVQLAETEVMGKYGMYTRTFQPRICKVNREYMHRKPYYARFITKSGGFELRLICIHTHYGKEDNEFNRKIRQKELKTLLTDIYPQISDRRYGRFNTSYTILLGDYNAELWTKKSRKWQEPLKTKRGGKKPLIMDTDENGITLSEKYNNREIITVQDQLTTLRSKEGDRGDEKRSTYGFSYNYDHFSYEEKQFEGVKVSVKRIRRAVTAYCKPKGGDYNTDFEKYYKTVSDHVPIMMELEFNNR